MEPLSEQKIQEILSQELESWQYKDDKIHRNYKFDDFTEAMSFLVRIGFMAEKQMHHPEIFNVYNTVKISLSTHDVGGKVTDKDLKLAKAIEKIYK
ncbi:MAG: 4a-hydroxytetrahydrobiopterin dehydratase [Balneolaceae bacterium]